MICGISDTANLSVHEPQLQIQSALDSGDAERALEIAVLHGDDVSNPLLFVLEAQARVDLQKPISSDYKRASRAHIVDLFYSILDKDSDYEDPLFQLIRLIECLPSSAVAGSIKLPLLNAASDQSRVSHDELLNQFVSAAFIDPMAVQILPPARKAQFLQMLSVAGYEHSDRLAEQSDTTSGSDILNADTGSQLSYTFAVLRALATTNNEALLQLSDAIPAILSKRFQREITRDRIHSLLNLSRIAEALDTIATAYLADPLILLMLPIVRCVAAVREEDTELLGKDLPLSIVYDLYIRYLGDDRAFIRSDAYEDFLLALGYKKPSDLTSPIDGVRTDYLIYYLRYVSVPEVMLTSGAFASSRELEDERLKVLALLRTMDPDNISIYNTEIREITRRQIIHDGLRHVEQSKLAMDIQPLKRWADKNLKESFARYQALSAAGIRPSGTATPPLSMTDENSIPVTPLDEGIGLLYDMLSSFLSESYTNSFHGLDSYLSMRARHGSFAGQLRAPLEEENIVTSRDALSDEYKPNEYWLKRLPNYSDAVQEIDALLRAFSKNFDTASKTFADSRLQIKSADKPNGLFEYTIEDLDLRLLSAEVKDDTSFSQFMDQCFLIFWENVEASLTQVRATIEIELKTILNQNIDDLQVALDEMKERGIYVGDLESSVLSAQTRLQQSIEGLKEWFHTPKPVSPIIFTMDAIVDISLQQVKRMHPDFDPIVTKNISVDFSVLQLTRFTDVFFIIFENIQRHSGVGESPQIEIRISANERMEIEVLSEMLTLYDIEPKLHGIRELIAANKFQRIVKSEGGTGLVKLWNLVRLENASFDFGVQDSRFRVFISSPISIVSEVGGGS